MMQEKRERLYRGILSAMAAGGCGRECPGTLRTYLPRQRPGYRAARRAAPPHRLGAADAPCPNEDVALALAYFELLAQSAGWGTVWCGLLKMALQQMPALKPLYDLPAEHVYYAMLFGVPTWRYPRTVQRDRGAEVRRIIAG